MRDWYWKLVSGWPRGEAAISVLEVAGDVEGALRAMGVRAVEIGEIAVRDLGGIDRGVVARLGEVWAAVMCHGNGEVVGEILKRGNGDLGIGIGEEAREARGDMADGKWEEGGGEGTGGEVVGNDRVVNSGWPEAEGDVEWGALEALSEAGSAGGVDYILGCLRRGEVVDGASAWVRPRLVAAVGRGNIGKSSLLNALAGRRAAEVADEAGTTRDYVGVMVDLGGLVVRWVDLPGFDGGGGSDVLLAAQELARGILKEADVVVMCADPRVGWAHEMMEYVQAKARVLRVVLRSDLFAGDQGNGLRVSAKTGEGILEFVERMRELILE
ncbi:hypothetical protein BH11PLA1_BH11PLA1_03780 [soil metagenome]